MTISEFRNLHEYRRDLYGLPNWHRSGLHECLVEEVRIDTLQASQPEINKWLEGGGGLVFKPNRRVGRMQPAEVTPSAWGEEL